MPPIDRSKFGTNTDAYLIHLASRPAADAIPALLSALADGTWRTNPKAWSAGAWGHVNANTWSLREMVAAVSAEMMKLPLAEEVEAVHLFFPWTVGGLADAAADGDGEALGALLKWFTDVARPGDAKIAAKALGFAENATTRKGPSAITDWGVSRPLSATFSPLDQFESIDSERRSRLLPHLTPLVTWLLEHGPSVMRAEGSGDLPFAAEIVLQHDPSRIISVLEFAMASKEAVFWPPQAHDASQPRVFWPAIERALASNAPPDLMWGLVRLHSRWPPEAVLEPLLHDQFPLARAVLVQALGGGVFGDQREWWFFLFSRPPSIGGELRLTELSVAHELLDRLVSHPHNPALAQWATVLTREYLRIVDFKSIREGLDSARERLLHLTRFPHLSSGVAAGLREALREGLIDSSIAREVLENNDHVGAATSAILALPVVERVPVKASDAAIEELRTWLEGYLQQPWLKPFFGVNVGRILGESSKLRFAHLANEDQLSFEGEVLALELNSVKLIAKEPALETRHQLGLLYLLHELIHAAQGLHSKVNIHAMREAGAEHFLLEFDLEADHLASLFANDAVRRWSIAELKRTQARSLSAFPVRWMHTEASATRKALRLSSIFFDARFRGQNHSGQLGDGYAGLTFAEGGGRLVAFASGPPRRHLANVPLSAKDATFLLGLTREGHATAEAFERLEKILTPLLALARGE